MSDEFIEDDFIEENEGAASNRPFLIAVGALVTVFILAAVCTLAFLNMRGDSVTNAAEVAAIETQNAITIVTNTAVAQFIAQTETAQAAPTNTPELAATNTSTPTPAGTTAAVTSTPVIDEAGAGTAVGEGEEGTAGEVGTGTPLTGTVTSAAGTIIIGGDNGTGGTEATRGTDTAGGSGSTGTGGVALTRAAMPAATTAAQTGSQTGALPQTGLETWVIALVGLLLVGVVVVVHRLRAS